MVKNEIKGQIAAEKKIDEINFDFYLNFDCC